MILRRRLAGGLGTIAIATAAPAGAQQARLPRLSIFTLDNFDAIQPRMIEALGERGLVDGRTVVMDFRSAGGDQARLGEIAVELAGRPVDVIIAWQTPAAVAAKRATSRIPIVMHAGDPIGNGLIASFARPGGNVTGSGGLSADLVGKPIEFVRECLPALRRIGAVINGGDPFSTPLLAALRDVTAVAGIELHEAVVRNPGELEAAISGAAAARVGALFVQPSLPHVPVIALAHARRLPTFSIGLLFAYAGGLLSYGLQVTESINVIATYVDRILKGAKPEDLPVARPTRFELVINLRAARALGLEIPGAVLARADEVIE